MEYSWMRTNLSLNFNYLAYPKLRNNRPVSARDTAIQHFVVSRLSLSVLVQFFMQIRMQCSPSVTSSKSPNNFPLCLIWVWIEVD